jgi:hypothetical protein
MRHFKVRDILKVADRERFHAMMDDNATVGAAHAWMIGRGYKISHGAVGNYMKSLRQGAVAEIRRSMSGLSDTGARNRITAILPRLCGSELAYLAALAEFMVMASGKGTSKR